MALPPSAPYEPEALLHPQTFDPVKPLNHNEPPKSTINASVSVLAATTLGAGTLALPYAMSQTGWLFGLALLIIIAFVSAYAVRILIRAAIKSRATSYEELGAIAFPKWGKGVVTLVTMTLVFGSLTAFLVIIADTVTPAVQHLVGQSFFTQRWVLLCIATGVSVLPLSLLRSVHALEKWAFLAVFIILAFAVVTCGMLLVAIGKGSLSYRDIVVVRFNSGFFNALPIVSLAYCCQPMVFPVYNALENNTYKRIRTVIHRSMALCALPYSLVGICGYVLYNTNVKGDVLDNLPGKDAFMNLMRISFTIAILIHYPVVHYAFRQATELTFFPGKEFSYTRHLIETVSVIFATLILALSLGDLSAVFSLTGALTAFWYCFLLPAFFFLKVHQTSWIRRTSKNELSEDGSVKVTVNNVDVGSDSITLNESLQRYDSESQSMLYNNAYPQQQQQPQQLNLNGCGLYTETKPLTWQEKLPVYVLIAFAITGNVISCFMAVKEIIDKFNAPIVTPTVMTGKNQH